MMWGGFGVILAICLQNTVLSALECYSCRGNCCIIPTPEHLVTCDLDDLLPPDTQFDTNCSDNLEETVQVIDSWPLIEEFMTSEEVTEVDNGIVIDMSELPGSESLNSRDLLSLAGDEDLLRCVAASYEEGSGEMSTVRSCAVLDTNNYHTCQNLAEGALLSCYVCNSDRCNSTTRTTAAITAFPLLAALVKLLF